MSAGIRAVRDRIHTLLTSTSGVRRALSTPLRRELDSADSAVDTAETLAPSYVLRWAGDEDNSPKDSIVGNRSLRMAHFSLTLSVFKGSGESSGSDTQESDAQLADLWEEVVQVLENPENYLKPTTGWVWAGNFRAVGIATLGARAMLQTTFDVRYDARLENL